MPFQPTRAALDRPKRTIHACELVHAQAGAIVAACREASPGEAVLAVVNQDEMTFAGIWVVPTSELSARVGAIESGGWCFVFPSGTQIAAVEERCLETARLAFRRWETMVRLSGRRR